MNIERKHCLFRSHLVFTIFSLVLSLNFFSDNIPATSGKTDDDDDNVESEKHRSEE